MNPQEPLPLDSAEQLAQALREQGMASDDIPPATQALMQLTAWQAPIPTASDTARLVNRLAPLLPTLSPVRRALRTQPQTMWNDLLHILQIARVQVSILRRSFWLLSIAVVLLGLGILINTDNASQRLILLALGPLLSYLGALSAFRGAGLHVIEFELACPPSMRQLTLARLVLVLGVDVLLGLLVSILLSTRGQEGPLTLTLHWLAPLLLVTGIALLLSLRHAIHRAAGAAYGGWLLLLLLIWLVRDTGGIEATFTVPSEVTLALIGLACLAVALRYSSIAMPGLLPRRL